MVYRKPLNTMGLLGMLFGSSPKTKSDFDAEIAKLQGELAIAKQTLRSNKEWNRTSAKKTGIHRDILNVESNIRYLTTRIASLKAARAKAPKG